MKGSMKMNAVIFGAGNIGRGFIGPLFSEAGAKVTFIDVSPIIVSRIRQDGEYPLEIVGGEPTVKQIKNIFIADGNDRDAAVQAILEADIAATCVGAKAIQYIIPNLAAGIRARSSAGKPPLNLLICENLMDADTYIRDLLAKELTETQLEQIGLVETSVGRMVPSLKQNAEDGQTVNPLRIAVEEYCVLPVDQAAFRGSVLEIPNMVPFTPFHYYIERKLFVHNMGHAVCAYLGQILGYTHIWESIGDPLVRLLAQNAMLESAGALSKKYHVDCVPLLQHISDLLRRFGNRALGDTCARVGADIPRKLARLDRLTGAACTVLEQGAFPVYICTGSAAALHCYMKENKLNQADAENVLVSLTGLGADHPITVCTMEMYTYFAVEKGLSEIFAATEEKLHEKLGMIV